MVTGKKDKIRDPELIHFRVTRRGNVSRVTKGDISKRQNGNVSG